MKIKQLCRKMIFGITGGMAIAALTHEKEHHIFKKTLLEKVNKWDRRLYEDGLDQAKMIETIKQDIEQAVRK